MTEPDHRDMMTMEDRGCSYIKRGGELVVIPKCLECWRPQCRYDSPATVRREEAELRRAAIRRTYETGLSVIQVAEKHGQSVRVVQRALAATVVWGKRE